MVGRDQGHLLADPGGAGVPQLHRQAVLHPQRIDAARSARRRSAGGEQISVRLFVRVADVSHDAVREGAAVRQPARTRRRGDRHPAGHADRLYQARHRPARRPAGGARRAGDPERRAGEARAAPLCRSAGRRQFDLRPERISRRAADAARRRPRLPFADRHRDAAGRAQLRYDRSRSGLQPRRQLRADHGAREQRLPDGRQSRSQRRQPLPARRTRPRRPGAVGICRRARRIHHLLARRQRDLEPVDLVRRVRSKSSPGRRARTNGAIPKRGANSRRPGCGWG